MSDVMANVANVKRNTLFDGHLRNGTSGVAARAASIEFVARTTQTRPIKQIMAGQIQHAQLSPPMASILTLYQLESATCTD